MRGIIHFWITYSNELQTKKGHDTYTIVIDLEKTLGVIVTFQNLYCLSIMRHTIFVGINTKEDPCCKIVLFLVNGDN